MQVRCSKDRHTLVVDIDGELDHHTADFLRDKVDSVLEDPNIKNIVFDLKKLKFMDSSGIGVLIGRYKVVSQRGGVVAVTGVTPQINKIFEVSGLYKIIKKYNSLDTALRDIGGAVVSGCYK